MTIFLDLDFPRNALAFDNDHSPWMKNEMINLHSTVIQLQPDRIQNVDIFVIVKIHTQVKSHLFFCSSSRLLIFAVSLERV